LTNIGPVLPETSLRHTTDGRWQTYNGRRRM